MDLFRFRPGPSPLIVSMPHTGTHVPEWLAPRLSAAARALPDTDWHLERLYDYIVHRPGVWLATGAEILDWYRSVR